VQRSSGWAILKKQQRDFLLSPSWALQISLFEKKEEKFYSFSSVGISYWEDVFTNVSVPTYLFGIDT
jgi:hypothetical protein